MLSSDRINKIKELLNTIGAASDKYELFDEALTHPSYNTDAHAGKGYDYERLEFLGDSVLRLAAGEYLFYKYPDYNEGPLTKIRSCIVSDKFIAGLAQKLGYYKYIDLGAGEEKSSGRLKESILACTFEAVLGAVYTACGFQKSKDFLYALFDNENIEETIHYYNAKEILQEYTQSLNKDLPEYRVISEKGPAHDKTFEVCVFYHNIAAGKGFGKTKKEAEQAAARDAVNKIKK